MKQNAKEKIAEEAMAVEKRKQEILIEKANLSILPEKKRMSNNNGAFSLDKPPSLQRSQSNQSKSFKNSGFHYQSPKKKHSNYNHYSNNNNSKYNRQFTHSYDYNSNYSYNNHSYYNNHSHSNRSTPKPKQHHQKYRYQPQSARKENRYHSNNSSGWAKKGSNSSIGRGDKVKIDVSSHETSKSPDKRSRSVSVMSGGTSVTVGPIEVTEAAIAWRMKQIAMGKETIGYKNYISKVKRKNRLESDPQTPDAKERIGKKRFVGKLAKWRHFLHSFDNNNNSSKNDNNNNSNENEAKVNLNEKLNNDCESNESESIDIELVPNDVSKCLQNDKEEKVPPQENEKEVKKTDIESESK